MFASILLCPIFVILHFTINDCIITCDAVLASPFPFTLSLPDGTMSDNITIVGSPAFFLTQDERGYTVLVDSKDKFVKYAVVDAATGQIKPSNMKMSKDANPEKLGITKGVQPTEEAKKINCGEYCEDEVAVHEYVKPRRSCNRFCSITGGISRRLRNWNPGLADWMLPKSWIEQDVSDVDDETAAEERLHRRQRRRNLSIVGGKLVNLVIPIRFADHASRPMIPKEDIDILFNAVNGHKELAPTGSIRDVFAWSSYGKMIVESTVVDWITLSNTESFYAGGKSGFTEAFSAGLKEALDHLENDPTFDFATFDRNGDRKIDAITFLHSGYGAEWGAVDCSSGNDSKERIWSHKWKLKPQEWTSQKSGVTVSEYHVSPSFFGTCGSEIFRIGTLAHEMGRFIGLPDIYGGGPPHGGYGIGSFGLMSNSWGFDGSQMNPPVLSAWGKMEMGWLSPDIISASGHYELPPIHGSPKAYKIFLGSADEFLLIENRPATSFTSKSGLLIFHIDNEASHRPEGVVGPKGSHYRVSLVQADGKHELELGVNRGDEGDIFVAGNTLGIGFTGEGDPTYPNTDSYRGGALTPTGISIASITDPDENGYVRFSVTFPGEQLPDLTPPTPSPTSQPKLELVRTELMTTFAGGAGSFGVMFDAVAIKGLTITSADLHLSVGEDDGEKAIEIYTAVGTHLGIEKSPEKWTKVCCAKKVLGNGLMKRTPTSSLWLQQVNMSPGERRGWYITSDEPIVRYSRSEKSDCCEVFTNSAHLQIEEGQGVGGYPWGNTLKRRIWNVSMVDRYTV
jgi:M6 family metalloprotease-like protein